MKTFLANIVEHPLLKLIVITITVFAALLNIAWTSYPNRIRNFFDINLPALIASVQTSMGLDRQTTSGVKALSPIETQQQIKQDTYTNPVTSSANAGFRIFVGQTSPLGSSDSLLPARSEKTFGDSNVALVNSTRKSPPEYINGPPTSNFDPSHQQ